MSDYVSDSMAWSVLGLVAGYLLGKTEVTIRAAIANRKGRR